MMNYVAIQCVAVFINKFATGGSNTLPTIYEGSLGMIYEYLTPILIVASNSVGALGEACKLPLSSILKYSV